MIILKEPTISEELKEKILNTIKQLKKIPISSDKNNYCIITGTITNSSNNTNEKK